MRLGKLLRRGLLVCVFLFALAEQAIADSLADAKRAHEAGDYITAAKLLKPLAEQGNASAQTFLGEIYETGQGVPQSYKEAVKWYRLAAKQGNIDAQVTLGDLLTFEFIGRQGVPQSYKEAAKWFKLAAEQGSSWAQVRLARMYRNGQGVLQDYKEAVKWYRLAAKQGSVDGQLDLADMYGDGLGVPQNFILAYMWDDFAASGDASLAQELAVHLRNFIATQMTAQQIAEAQELARKCAANKFKGC